jgi:hypothetical protein
MGYSTDFNGDFNITPQPSEEFSDKFNEWKDSRRVAIDVTKLPSDVLVNSSKYTIFGDIGKDGSLLIGQDSMNAPHVPNYNSPGSMPGLWCQWEIDSEFNLAWDGGEKFYHYIDWLYWLIENIFEPQGFTLNGECEWCGEEREDYGVIRITNNKIEYSDFGSGFEKLYSLEIVDGAIEHIENHLSVTEKFRRFIINLDKKERNSEIVKSIEAITDTDSKIEQRQAQMKKFNLAFVKDSDGDIMTYHLDTLESLSDAFFKDNNSITITKKEFNHLVQKVKESI